MNALMLYKRWGVDAAVAGNGPDGTQNYVPVTIQASQVSSALTDYPAYVRLSDLPAAFWSSVQADGGDIRVTEDDGTTRAPVDLVSIDAGASTGELHFLAFSVSASSNTVYRIYYNGTSTLSQPAVGDTYGRNAVWGDQEAVFHLEEDPSGVAPQMIDSTGNGFDGTSEGGMASGDLVPAKIGDGLDFDGNDDAISAGASGLDIANDLTFTFSAWAYLHTPSERGSIVGKISYDPSTPEFTLFHYGDGGNGWRVTIRDNSSAVLVSVGSNATADTWALLHAVGDGSTLYLYVDGSLVGSTSLSGVTPDTSGEEFSIGSDFNGSSRNRFPFDGLIDEVRARNSALGADWIAAEHTNQNDPATFYSVGSEQAA